MFLESGQSNKDFFGVPFLHKWQESSEQQIQADVQEANAANAISGAQSEAARRSWEAGHQQHPGPETRTIITSRINAAQASFHLTTIIRLNKIRIPRHSARLGMK